MRTCCVRRPIHGERQLLIASGFFGAHFSVGTECVLHSASRCGHRVLVKIRLCRAYGVWFVRFAGRLRAPVSRARRGVVVRACARTHSALDVEVYMLYDITYASTNIGRSRMLCAQFCECVC